LFSTLSKDAAAAWLSTGELTLLLGAALIVIGLIGEYSRSGRLTPWIRVFEVVVIVGVAVELVADGVIFGASGRLTELQEEEVVQVKRETAIISERAATLEVTAAELRNENLELEAALAGVRKDQKAGAQRVGRVEQTVGSIGKQIGPRKIEENQRN
jgi:low affinity Fe/Cu permease